MYTKLLKGRGSYCIAVKMRQPNGGSRFLADTEDEACFDNCGDAVCFAGEQAESLGCETMVVDLDVNKVMARYASGGKMIK